MGKANRTIDCTVGIYDNVQYRLTMHRNGSVTVRVPTIKWVNNSGSLHFYNVKKYASVTVAKIKWFFENDCLADEHGQILDDLLA